MEIMKFKYISNAAAALAALSLFSPLQAAAQFDQSIAVDGKYTPEIIRLDRINAFPRQERFALETRPLDYDASGVTASFAPSIVRMGATGWQDSRIPSSFKGYVDLGLGSWLNSTLSAGYRFINSDETTLGVKLLHNSTSLWKPEILSGSAIRQKRYDESAGIFGSHIFPGYGRLDAEIDCHFGYFNYYGYAPAPVTCGDPSSPKAPTQSLNDLSARVGWTSSKERDDLEWNVSAGARYFGYRRFYIPALDADINCLQPAVSGLTPSRETDINIRGGISIPGSSKSRFGIDLNADVLLYSGLDSGKSRTAILPPEYSAPDNYALITLTPYYRFSISRLNLRIGARVDIAAKAGEEGDRYSALHFAPDVTLDSDAGAAQLYLHLLGGSRLHTLASESMLDYYSCPTLLSTRPVYSPLDGSFGASFGPFSGFSAGVEFAFRVSRGEYLGGWYQEFLNNIDGMPAAGLPATADNGKDIFYNYLNTSAINMHGFSLGAKVSYDMGRFLKLKGNVNYQPQNGRKGFFNGLDRPRLTAAISAESNPWSTLGLTLSYTYRGVRKAYITGQYIADNRLPREILASRRLPDITYLNFGASYGFSNNLTLRVQADNLLNRHDEILPGLPTQGLTLSAGLSFLF